MAVRKKKKTPARKKAPVRKKKTATRARAKKKAPVRRKTRTAVRRKKKKKIAPAPRPKKPEPKRWALVLNGNWSRGAFLAGALDAIRRRPDNPTFPLVAGAGSGALAAALVALGKWDELRNVYYGLQRRRVVRARYGWLPGGAAASFLFSTITHTDSLFDVRKGLIRLVDEHVDAEALAKCETEVHFSAIDMQSGATHSFNNRQDPPDQLRAGLLAAASRPVLMPLVRAGYARHQHAEGTLRRHGPLAAVFRALARENAPAVDRVVAISTAAPPGNHPRSYRDIADVTERTVRLLTGDRTVNAVRSAQLVNAVLGLRDAVPKTTFARAVESLDPAAREELERHLHKRRVPLVHVHPPTPAGASTLDFDPAASRAAYDAGAATVSRLAGAI